jgi:hypothetical protein
MNKQDVLSLGFSKQKRGLVVSSFLLIFLALVEPDFSNAKIAIFGIKLNDPKNAVTIIWLIFGIYAFRYAQYLYQADNSYVFDMWKSDFASLVAVSGKRVYRWMRKKNGITPERQCNYNFSARICPDFRLVFDSDKDGLFVRGYKNLVENQDDSRGRFSPPILEVMLALLIASLKNVFIRPMFIEVFGPLFFAGLSAALLIC